jgi:hypothetical protein
MSQNVGMSGYFGNIFVPTWSTQGRNPRFSFGRTEKSLRDISAALRASAFNQALYQAGTFLFETKEGTKYKESILPILYIHVQKDTCDR